MPENPQFHSEHIEGLQFERALIGGMSVGYEGINANKFPPAAKWTLHISNPELCNDFTANIPSAVTLFPDPCKPGVQRRLQSQDVLSAITHEAVIRTTEVP